MTAENAKMFATVEERTRRAKASKNNGENRLEKGKMREETKSKLQYQRKAESTFSLYACHSRRSRTSMRLESQTRRVAGQGEYPRRQL